MNLRYKVLLTLAAAFIVIILILVVISTTFILSSYSRLESKDVVQEVNLVSSYFSSRMSAISLLARDWGAWDDTYFFVTGKNPGFIDANLNSDSFQNLELNILIITDAGGNPLYSTGYNFSSHSTSPVPLRILQELSDPTSPLRDMSGEKPVEGYVSLPEGPLLLAAYPVIHSDNSGPPVGMIIMGRYVDEPMIAGISTAQHIIGFVPKPAPSGTETRVTSPVTTDFESPAGGDAPVVVRPFNTTVVTGSTHLKDIRGNDAFVLSVQMPRDIYQQGRSTILSFLLILISIALIVGIIVIWLTDTLVLSRLDSLNRDVDNLGRSGDLSKRLAITGDDEINHLAGSMNTTLDHLERTWKDLQKSEVNYRTLIDTTPTGIIQADLSGTILFANNQMALNHGHHDIGEICGKFFFDLIAPNDRERAMKDFKRAAREGQLKNLEYEGVKYDGTRFWLEMSISAIRTRQGEPESFIVVSRDISRRMAREIEIKKSGERYRTVFENTGTATVIIEEDGILSLINSEFERLSGYTRSEIEGKMRWSDFVVPEDIERMHVLHNQRRIDPASTLKKYEFRFISKIGTTRFILLSVDLIPGTTTSIASLIDITDRKRAEESVAASENTLTTIIDSSPIPLFVIDRNHHLIHWNKALELLSGIPASRVLGTDQHWTAFYKHRSACMADLVVDGVIEQIPEFYTGKITRNGLHTGQYDTTVFFPELGTEGKWLYCTSTCTCDGQGRVTGAIEMFVDITDRKKIEDEAMKSNEQLNATLQELRAAEELLNRKIRELEEAKHDLTRSEARYRDIATNIPGIVFQFVVHNKDRQTVPFTSERAFSLFTLGPDEVYSNPNALFNLIHDEDAAQAKQSLEESARTLVSWNIVFRMKSGGRDIRWFNGRAVPHMLDTGDVVWHGVLIDITEQKLAEIALSESEQKFRAIFDQTFQFMGLMTPDGTLIQANHTAIEQSGRDERDIIGKPFWDTPWWSDSPEQQERLKRAIRNVAAGEFERFEATHPSADGRIIYVDFSLKPVKDAYGTVVYLIPEGRDITERKLLQEKIGTALKEKELLLKEIHHRVKNNIQVIASLLNMQARTVEDPAIKEVLREAQNRVKSIALVHEKLYQSKNLDRIDYHDYLQKIARHLFESYGVSPRNVVLNIHADNISMHIDKAVPCSLIINELLSNAFKHAFPHERKGDVWIDIRREGPCLVLNYRDNGVGLPENISVEQSESLGMRLLQGLTRQLHGKITIHRIAGTQITIMFPFENDTEAEA